MGILKHWVGVMWNGWCGRNRFYSFGHLQNILCTFVIWSHLSNQWAKFHTNLVLVLVCPKIKGNVYLSTFPHDNTLIHFIDKQLGELTLGLIFCNPFNTSITMRIKFGIWRMMIKWVQLKLICKSIKIISLWTELLGYWKWHLT